MTTKIEVLYRDPNERWGCCKVKIMPNVGEPYIVQMTHDDLAIAELKLKLVENGAKQEDLEKLCHLLYDKGTNDEREANAGSSL